MYSRFNDWAKERNIKFNPLQSEAYVVTRKNKEPYIPT